MKRIFLLFFWRWDLIFFILLLEVVFLQFRDEMRRVNLPLTVSSLDAIKVLFMNAFPGQISMPDFEAEEKSIYIKDHETGVFFQLDDVRYFYFHFFFGQTAYFTRQKMSKNFLRHPPIFWAFLTEKTEIFV